IRGKTKVRWFQAQPTFEARMVDADKGVAAMSQASDEDRVEPTLTELFLEAQRLKAQGFPAAFTRLAARLTPLITQWVGAVLCDRASIASVPDACNMALLKV